MGTITKLENRTPTCDTCEFMGTHDDTYHAPCLRKADRLKQVHYTDTCKRWRLAPDLDIVYIERSRHFADASPF